MPEYPHEIKGLGLRVTKLGPLFVLDIVRNVYPNASGTCPLVFWEILT